MKRIHAHALAVAALATAVSAYAQTPPAPSPAPAPAVVMAKHSCVKPEHPGRLASDNMKRAWQRDASAYLDCLKKFANDQQQVAQEYIKAANATVDEYNTAVKDFQATAEKAAAQ